LTPNGYDSSNCLQGVDVNILSNEAANQMLISSGQNPAITDNECATTGIGTIRQGACHGDSGGPLSIWDNQLNKNILLGIVSWGIPNCVGNNSNSPSVFVRVSMILNWIYSNILSISGPSTICDQAEYEIPTLPNGAIVEWSLAHTGSGAYPQLIQNTPEPNKCTIINPHRYPLTTTLTANIMINGTNVISLNKTVTSMGNSAVQYGHFFQQGCVVNGITQKTRSGSFSSDSYFYLNQGCLAEITLYDMAGRSVLFHSGYPPGYWSYNSSNSKLLVRPAVGSSGVPTSFKITGGCQDRSLMYFTYSLSEGSMTLSPNPASDFVTVSVNDSERGEFKLLDSDNLILESVSSLTSSYEIQLWNSSGLVKQVETDQPSYQLNLTGVPPGFYYVHVIKDGQTYRRQLVVQ